MKSIRTSSIISLFTVVALLCQIVAPAFAVEPTADDSTRTINNNMTLTGGPATATASGGTVTVTTGNISANGGVGNGGQGGSGGQGGQGGQGGYGGQSNLTIASGAISGGQGGQGGIGNGGQGGQGGLGGTSDQHQTADNDNQIVYNNENKRPHLTVSATLAGLPAGTSMQEIQNILQDAADQIEFILDLLEGDTADFVSRAKKATAMFGKHDGKYEGGTDFVVSNFRVLEKHEKIAGRKYRTGEPINSEATVKSFLTGSAIMESLLAGLYLAYEEGATQAVIRGIKLYFNNETKGAGISFGNSAATVSASDRGAFASYAGTGVSSGSAFVRPYKVVSTISHKTTFPKKGQK